MCSEQEVFLSNKTNISCVEVALSEFSDEFGSQMIDQKSKILNINHGMTYVSALAPLRLWFQESKPDFAAQYTIYW